MRYLPILSFMFACALLVCATITVKADPSTEGASNDNPFEYPGDAANAVGRTGTSVNSPRYVYIKNSSRAKNADKIEFVIKGDKKKDNPQGNNDDYEYRIIVEDVTNPTTGNSVVDSKDPVDGTGAKVEVALDPAIGPGGMVRAKVRVERKKKKDGGNWEPDTNGENVNFNIRLLDGNNAAIVQAGTGDDPFGAEDTELAAVFDEPDFGPASCDADTATTVEAPELFFSERNGWRMPVGELRFHATGGAAFTTQVGTSLAIEARNEAGEDAISEGEVECGTPYIDSGVLVVPIDARDAEAVRNISLRVTGAFVTVPALASGTMIGYAVGGSSSGSEETRIPALVRIGGAPESGSLAIGRAAMTTTLGDDEEEYANEVGGRVHVAWIRKGEHTGFLDAIVIDESTANYFRAGSFEITPIDDFHFVNSTDTRLYVLDQENEQVEDAFDSATISVTTSGAIRVTLAQRSSTETLRLVILNPKVNLGEAPYSPGQNARVAIGGSALRSGFSRVALLVERDNAEGYEEPLFDEPLGTPDLTPIAAMN